MYAYPLIYQIRAAVEHHRRSLSRGQDLTDFKGHLLRVANDMCTNQFSDRVGWDVTKILAESQELWELNTDGFWDVAKAAGVEWTAAFPRSGGPAT
jgi:hypothetical protein